MESTLTKSHHDPLHLTSPASTYLTLTPNRDRRCKHGSETVRFFGNVHRGPVPVRGRRWESERKKPRSSGVSLRAWGRPLSATLLLIFPPSRRSEVGEPTLQSEPGSGWSWILRSCCLCDPTAPSRLDPMDIGMIVDRGHDFPSHIQAKLDSYGSGMWLFRDDPTRGTTKALNHYRGDHRGFVK